MTKDWKRIAEGSGLAVTAAEIEKFAPGLTALDEAFQKLLPTLDSATEPAITLSEAAVEGQ